MSAPRPNGALDELTRELREATDAAPRVDWSAVDGALFARIGDAARSDAATARAGRIVWWPAAAALAVAAAVAVLVEAPRDSAPIDAAIVDSAASDGAILLSADGATIDGRAAKAGDVVHVGSVLETSGGRAALERPGKLTMWVEPSSRVAVSRATHAAGALIVALERGAIEAQVVPVPEGEAFAIDVGASRVAVHGTHLRVARDGDRVAVDLTEGVVSIGAPPRSGSTFGDLVTAPAHADFAAGNVAATLSVSHAPSTVRPAFSPAEIAVAAPPVATNAPSKAAPAQPALSPVAVAPKVLASAPAPDVAPAVPPADPNAEATVAQSVRACLAAHPPATDVTVTVSTEVDLDVGANGFATMARFSPPLAPDVQACAAAVIYKTRFSRTGSVAIPVSFSR